MIAQQRSDRQPDEELEEILRRSLRQAGDGFDYNALVAGVHQRAHRIRVRRTVTVLAAAAVLVPAAVASASLLPDVVSGPQELGPATTGEDDQGAGQDNGQGDGPPYQDGQPPLPEGGESTGASPNGWEVPDARPTGIDLLEEWGPPSDVSYYPRLPVFSGTFVCDPEQPGGLEPVAGQWSHYVPGQGRAGSMWDVVDIHVTGWEDGAQAMADLRDDALLCAWDVRDGESLQREVPWPGHEGDTDYFRNEPYLFEELGDSAWVGVAGVRTGDYIVGVTVRHTDQETADALAREIAEKTAANLEVLDPEHAGD